MLDPRELYTFADDLPDDLERPVLLYHLDGFIDAGRAVQRARFHLFAQLDHRPLVHFDTDQLVDYRSWRPHMNFRQDHYAGYDEPALTLHLLYDLDGVPFLLLAGREPDLQWERFVAAVEQLVHHFQVGLNVELHAIPMTVPHTRPVSFTAHGNRTDLMEQVRSWKHKVYIPASLTSLLEYRLGKARHDTFGLAVHVPYYLVETEYHPAAAALLDTVARLTGLSLPLTEVNDLATQTRGQLDQQVAESAEVTQLVRTLEQQYDAWDRGDDGGSLLDPETGELPTADELARQFERFLAEHDEGRNE